MKKKYSKKLLMLLLVAFNSMFLFAQNDYWSKASKAKLENVEKVHRASHPRVYHVFNLDLEKFQETIAGAPLRGTVAGPSNVIAEFPISDGTFQRFRISESPILAPELAEKFPMIKTYKAVGVDDPTATMRFSITQFGLHTMTLSGKRSSTYIDPYTEDRTTYMVYDRTSLGADLQGFECLTDNNNVKLKSLSNEFAGERADTDDQKLRTYRLAQSCTGEYGAIFAGGGTVAQQKANVQAQMAITMNRVNEIYERDLAITMVFIANNDQIIYLNAATDPWTNEWNTTTQTEIDGTIGSANYDIGHNFNTTGGGNAGCLGCVCTAGQKGSAYTGRADPTGDPFDIDYVAHEMGHQFNGWHSMNTCSRSGNGTTEVEPASGSSIMGYAGICATNVQANSDAHFNYVNVRDIQDNVQTGASSSCDVETSLTNQPPVADAGADYTIPKSTPFVLRGSAADPDGTATLTYNWAPNDPAQAPTNGSPQSTWTQGPMYRSILPTTSPDRWLPRIDDVVANNLTPTWEVTPSVARTMNFSFIVRDNGSGFANGIGQTDADLMVVTVEDVTPFTMSAPNTALTWNVGNTETVTWNVGQTTNATINCQNVNIKLSLDGGYTYPITLVSNTPNDGSQDITVPNNITTTARVMVEAADNIFYDISNTNFTIAPPTNPTFTLTVPANEQSQTICTGNDGVVNIAYDVFSGFNESTAFSASGNPAGSTVNFSVNNINSSQTVVATLTNTAGVTPGVYPVTITATSASVTRNEVINFTIYSSTFAASILTYPGDGATNIPIATPLNWAADANAASYDIQVATDAGFTTGLNTYNATTNTFNLSGLAPNTTYYWRIAPKNSCGTAAYSSAFSFTTATVSCTTYNSTQNNLNIPGSGTTEHVVTSTITINDDVAITDVNTTINVDHLWAGDIELKLTSPNGTEVILLPNSKCDDGTDDIAVTYDDQAGGPLACSTSAPAVGGTVQPENPLSAFNGESSLGDWILTVTDGYPSADGGTFLNYNIEICGTPALSISEESLENIAVFPNPNNGSFTLQFTSNSGRKIEAKVFDIRGRKIYDESFASSSTFNQVIQLNNVSSGVYLLDVTDGERRSIKRIVVK